MQPGWLKEFFKPREDEAAVEADRADGSTEATDDVSRRDFVKTGFATGMAAGLAAGAVVAQTGTAGAQATANPLSPGNWWPSPWGAGDQRGANNRITPAKVLEAARLIKTGRI